MTDSINKTINALEIEILATLGDAKLKLLELLTSSDRTLEMSERAKIHAEVEKIDRWIADIKNSK